MDAGFVSALLIPQTTVWSEPAARYPDLVTAVAAVHRHEASDRRRLTIAIGIVLATALVELWGSIATGSLTLLADVAHVLADAVASRWRS